MSDIPLSGQSFESSGPEVGDALTALRLKRFQEIANEVTNIRLSRIGLRGERALHKIGQDPDVQKYEGIMIGYLLGLSDAIKVASGEEPQPIFPEEMGY